MLAFPPPINFIALIILALRNENIQNRNDPINGFENSHKNEKNWEEAISLERKYTNIYYIDEIQKYKPKMDVTDAQKKSSMERQN